MYIAIGRHAPHTVDITLMELYATAAAAIGRQCFAASHQATSMHCKEPSGCVKRNLRDCMKSKLDILPRILCFADLLFTQPRSLLAALFHFVCACKCMKSMWLLHNMFMQIVHHDQASVVKHHVHVPMQPVDC